MQKHFEEDLMLLYKRDTEFNNLQ